MTRSTSKQKKNENDTIGAKEMVQLLRALVALTMEPGSAVPSTNPVAYDCHVTAISREMASFSGLCGHLKTHGSYYYCYCYYLLNIQFSHLNSLC